MTEMLELYRSVPRYVAARMVGKRAPGLIAGPLAPLRLVDRAEPDLPADGWVRLRPILSGVCGSDLAVLSGKSSFYFSPLVSMPFVPGHEVVADLLENSDGLHAGQRVVLDPVLSCSPRGEELCEACRAGLTGRCSSVTLGHVSPGLQTGYCEDTGGGWSGRMVAHSSQLFAVPDGLSDERAVLVEPLACAIHAAFRGRVGAGDDVLLVGAGTAGIMTLIALKAFADPQRVTVVAKHARQRELARALGADEVVDAGDAVTALRRSTRSLRLDPEYGAPFLMGGVDVAFDCAGSRSSLDMALRMTRAGGRVVLSGIPAEGADLTPVWFRELEVVGAYTTAMEHINGGSDNGSDNGSNGQGDKRHSFDLAIELARTAPLDGMVARYPLLRWREAIDHALSAGRLGAVKVAFDPGLGG